MPPQPAQRRQAGHPHQHQRQAEAVPPRDRHPTQLLVHGLGIEHPAVLAPGAGQFLAALVGEPEQQVDARHLVAQLRRELGFRLAAQAVVRFGGADDQHPFLLADQDHGSAALAGGLGQQPGLGGGKGGRSAGRSLIRLHSATVALAVTIGHHIVGQQQGGAVH